MLKSFKQAVLSVLLVWVAIIGGALVFTVTCGTPFFLVVFELMRVVGAVSGLMILAVGVCAGFMWIFEEKPE